MIELSSQHVESWYPDQVFLLGGWGCPSIWMNALGQCLEEGFGRPCEILSSIELETPSAFDEAFLQWKLRNLANIASFQRPLIVGWSYGGMLAVELANELNISNARVVTLGSRPRFIDDDFSVFDGPTAESFMKRIEASPVKGLNYFLTLVGRKEAKADVARLKKDVLEANLTQSDMVAGLKHLYSLDVRRAWDRLNTDGRITSVYFEQDALIRVPKGIEKDLVMSQGHLAPVLQAQDVGDRIIQILTPYK